MFVDWNILTTSSHERLILKIKSGFYKPEPAMASTCILCLLIPLFLTISANADDGLIVSVGESLFSTSLSIITWPFQLSLFPFLFGRLHDN